MAKMCYGCGEKYAQWQGLCRTCIKLLQHIEGVTIAAVVKWERSDVRRVKAPVKAARAPKFITIDRVEYEVVFDGSQRD